MEIPYEVIDQKPLDDEHTQVVVETQLPIVTGREKNFTEVSQSG